MCCAAIRDAACGDCVHYGAAQQHQAARESRPARSAGLPGGEFLIELDPVVDAAVDAALALAERGETKQARAKLTRLLREQPRNHVVCFGMGTLHTAENDPPRAIEWFDKAIAIFPYMVEAHYNKAVAYKELLDLPNSIRAFREVVKVGSSDDPNVQSALSILDDFEAGIREQEGIDMETFLVSADNFQVAFDLMRWSKWQQACDGFRKVIAMNERNVASHGNLGLCYAQLGHKAKALAELDRALELDPGYNIARTNRKVVATMTEGKPLGPAAFRIVAG